MLIVTPKNMIRTHFEWESKGYPHIPFPVGYISKCLFTLYLTLFLVSFLMYQIFIIISIASLLFFSFSYYLFMRLWKLLGLSSWKFNVFFFITGLGVILLASFIRSSLVSYLYIMGW